MSLPPLGFLILQTQTNLLRQFVGAGDELVTKTGSNQDNKVNTHHFTVNYFRYMTSMRNRKIKSLKLQVHLNVK